MTARTLALVAAVFVFLVLLADFLVVRNLGESQTFWYYGVLRTALFAIVAISSAAVARKFHWWSEHFGRAWTLITLAYTLLAVSEISRRLGDRDSLVSTLLVVTANLSLIGAYILMARSLRAAGLEYYGSRGRRFAFIGAAAVLAIVLLQSTFRGHYEAFQAGTLSLANTVSVTADFVTFLLVAPLLLTTLALRGGQLFWVFALLTTGTFGWMLNQGSGEVLDLLGASEFVATGRITGFAIACCFIAASAITHLLPAARATAPRGAR